MKKYTIQAVEKGGGESESSVGNHKSIRLTEHNIRELESRVPHGGSLGGRGRAAQSTLY